MVRVQLAYPKISDSKNCPLKRCVAFEKYDGTNLHWVWDVELGWYAFGTRRNRFDFDEMGITQFNAEHPGLEAAPALFRANFAAHLDAIFRESQRYKGPEVTVFTEFFGPNSFAGMHKQDDPKQLILFDVQSNSELVAPEQFIQDFKGLKIAQVIYRGKLTGQFIEDVRHGKYQVAEGVVCKGGKDASDLWMVKIKTNAYRQRLQQAFQKNWEQYWE
jgi:RNA ligase